MQKPTKRLQRPSPEACHSVSSRADRRSSRSAITIFEVVIALAIFMGAFAAISQIWRVGTRSSIRAQVTSEAVIRCERKMNEVVTGVIPMQSVSQTPFDDNANWVYSINLLDSGVPNLFKIETVVEHLGVSDGRVRFQLTRLIRDPQVFYDAASSSSGGSI